MDLVKIDIIRAQAAETVFTFLYNAFFTDVFIYINRCPRIVGAFKCQCAFCLIPAHPEFGQYLYLVARKATKRFSNYFFTKPLAINGRCIDGGYAMIIRCLY